MEEVLEEKEREIETLKAQMKNSSSWESHLSDLKNQLS